MAKLKRIDTSIFNNINVGVYRNTPGPRGKFIEVNAALVKMFGYTNKADFLRQVRPVDTYFYPQQRKRFSDLLLSKGFVKRQKVTLKKKDGSIVHAQVTANVVCDKAGRVKWFDGIVEDVTRLEEQQERFRLIFEHSPVAIWEEDFSCFARLIKQLKDHHVGDIAKYLAQHPDIVIKTFRQTKILDVNKAALALYGAKNKQELISNFGKTFTAGAVKTLINEFIALASGSRYFETEFKSKTLDGKLYDVVLRVSVPDGYEKTFSRVIVTIQNITDRKRLELHLKKMAQQDALTKLLNSRAISKRLEEELIRSRRYHSDLSCMMLDVDYFKTINDRFGHQRGDQILKRVAALIKNGLRRSDIVGRYGGDEFFIILTETRPQNARVAAERLRQIVSALSFKSSRGAPLKISISVGISGFPSPEIKDYRDLITQADRALYLAKASGRDCVVISKNNGK